MDQEAISGFVSIEIFNELGQSVWTSDQQEQSQMINLKNKTAGVYFMKVVHEGGISVQKLIVN